MCVVVFVVFCGRANWRAASSAAGCQELNRAASEVSCQSKNVPRSMAIIGNQYFKKLNT